MSRQSGTPPKPGVRAADAGLSSNIKLLMIAAAFLVVTIGLILLQPGSPAPTPTQVADVPAAPPSVAPAPVVAAAPATSLRPPATDTVARSAATLLDPVALPSASAAVSQQLRQPIRLTDTNAAHRDLPSLAASVLQDFGHAPRSGEDRLHALLVQALAERQSNAYIDALLNTAATRGEFAVPPRLERLDGRLDTMVLLAALVQRSAN